jgi:hypothetical protein
VSKQVWTVDELTNHYTSLGSVDGSNMQRVLDWTVKNGRFVESEAKAPLFSIAGKSEDRLFAVFASGHVYVWFEEHRYPGGVPERDSLAVELQNRNLMKANFDVTAIKEGKTMSRKLGDLSKEEIRDLLQVMGKHCL